uniref:Si:dkey-243k1.3 n=1 Tax=Cyprinus carpio TaxID=7962 RepID=A0A8C2IVY7_CYPCA
LHARSKINGHVVVNFWDSPDCIKFFYKEKVPDLGASLPDVVRLCQRFLNTYHFATLYNTHYHTAVYSAYIFQPSNRGGRETCWFIEPQVTIKIMMSQQNPDIYLREKQALNEDYTNSGFDRGHLNPNGHHAVPSRNATFTLTNVVPQNPTLNQNAWNKHESTLISLFNANCHQAYVLAGAIPSSNNWIIKNNVKRVNIPEYIWNAYCCVDQNGRPILSGAATALNTELNVVVEHTLDEMVDFLQQFSDAPVNELFSGQCKA